MIKIKWNKKCWTLMWRCLGQFPGFSQFLLTFSYMWGFPCGSAGKESACSVGDLGSIPGLGRSPGEGKGYPLQYSGLENSVGCIVHGVAKSQTRLSDFHFHFHMWGTDYVTLTSVSLSLWVRSWDKKSIFHDCCCEEDVTIAEKSIMWLKIVTAFTMITLKVKDGRVI